MFCNFSINYSDLQILFIEMKNGTLSSKGLPARHKETKLPTIMVSFNEPLEEKTGQVHDD